MVVSRVTTVVWPKNPAKDTRSADDWTKYCSCPFNGVTGHTEYATELAKISVSYGEYMGSKNSKGVTALKLPIISYFFLLFCIYQLTITVQNLNMKSLPPLRNRSLLHESKYEIFSYLLSRNIPTPKFWYLQFSNSIWTSTGKKPQKSRVHHFIVELQFIYEKRNCQVNCKFPNVIFPLNIF